MECQVSPSLFIGPAIAFAGLISASYIVATVDRPVQSQTGVVHDA